MRYRQLDENGDYTLGRRNHFLAGREAVGQAIKTRLLLLLGEWWEDIEDGLPLFEEILATFQEQDHLASIDLIFSERISATENVLEILSFDSHLDVNTRTYSAVCEISTVYGTVRLQIGGGTSSGEFISVKTPTKEVTA